MSQPRVASSKEILLEFESLRARLEEAEETLQAIRGGEVDAIVVYGAQGEQVYTLKGAEEPYRVFLEQMDEGAVTLGDDGVVLYANGGFARMLGAPLERVIGSDIREWFLEREQEVLDAALRSAEVVPRKVELKLVNDCPSLVSITKLDERHEAGFALIVTDTTEQKRHQQFLAQERLARSILGSAAEAIVVCDIDGTIIRASEEAISMAEGDALFRSFQEAFPTRQGDAPFAPHTFNQRIRGVEATLCRSDGSCLDLLVGVGPLKDDDGEPIGCVVTMADITDRNQAFREVRQLNDVLEVRVEERTEQLRLANRELESFCYSVSHDLRAPLRSMMAASMMLIEDHGDQLDTEAHSHLNRLAAAAKRMATLIDDLLQFSRLGRKEMTKQPVDLSALATSVSSEIVEREHATHMRVEVQPGIEVQGDPMLLRLLLENLIGNAVKFTKAKPDATLSFSADGATYVVRDNGIGFDPEYREKIFQPFERLHTDREFPGTGIGLANVHRIVSRHGGKVWAEGRPDEGASFLFTLGD